MLQLSDPLCHLDLAILRGHFFFNETIIPLVLVGYKTIIAKLSAACLEGYLSSGIQHEQVE